MPPALTVWTVNSGSTLVPGTLWPADLVYCMATNLCTCICKVVEHSPGGPFPHRNPLLHRSNLQSLVQFHRANSVVINPENTHNPYLSEEVTDEQHADPIFLPQSQYWIPASQVAPVIPDGRGYAIGFRDIARPTAAANLNCLCLDFIVRQKAQGTHLNWYIVEQLPVVADGDYDRRFGDKTARDLVRDHVLRLTYTAHDMAPFARDLGYDGPPFIWDGEERRHLRARLDALYFHLYGLSREDAGYVLDTFPIVQRQDEAAFGSYRTRDLILAYMNAFAAGDTDTVVSV